MAARDTWTMTTAVDTKVVVALWHKDPALKTETIKKSSQSIAKFQSKVMDSHACTWIARLQHGYSQNVYITRAGNDARYKRSSRVRRRQPIESA